MHWFNNELIDNTAFNWAVITDLICNNKPNLWLLHFEYFVEQLGYDLALFEIFPIFQF